MIVEICLLIAPCSSDRKSRTPTPNIDRLATETKAFHRRGPAGKDSVSFLPALLGKDGGSIRTSLIAKTKKNPELHAAVERLSA